MRYAGTDEKISVAIAGNRDSFMGTEFHTLDKSFVNDFERGDTDEYEFTDIDVRQIEFVVVKVEKAFRLNGNPDFYLEKLRVSVCIKPRLCHLEIPSKVGTQDVAFPFFQWITPNSEVFHQR